MKPLDAPFAYGPVRLRPLEHADLRETLAWRNRDGVRQQFKTSAVLAWEQHQDWFSRYLGKTDDIVFIVERAADGARIGQVAIYAIHAAASCAEVGRFVAAPEYQGFGLMREAIRALLALAQGRLGIAEVYLDVLETNLRAHALYLGLGFAETERRDGIVTMARSTAGGD